VRWADILRENWEVQERAKRTARDAEIEAVLIQTQMELQEMLPVQVEQLLGIHMVLLNLSLCIAWFLLTMPVTFVSDLTAMALCTGLVQANLFSLIGIFAYEWTYARFFLED
jgi:hypothetical protein